MSKLNVENVVSEIVQKVRVEVPSHFPSLDCKVLTPETAEAIAEDFGLIKSVRGPYGGMEATEAGLTFVGFDVKEYERQQKVNKKRASLERKAAKLKALLDLSDDDLIKDETQTENTEVIANTQEATKELQLS